MEEASMAKMEAEQEMKLVRGTILSNPVPTSISKQATCTAFLQKHCGNALRR